MATMNWGCQAYPWQMSLDTYAGKVDHMLTVASKAGFPGFELETVMLGRTSWAELADLLAAHEMKLAALGLALDWRSSSETDAEVRAAEEILNYLSRFPDTMLLLCQRPGKDRGQLRERQKNAVACIAAVAKRARDRGIQPTFHPNSPPGSVFRVQEDYDFLLDGLAREQIGFTPDVGHIAKGGMDPLEMIRRYRSLITHVHFKDLARDGEWALMGEGTINFQAIVDDLVRSGYAGWIVVEDESPLAETSPDQAVLACGQFINRLKSIKEK